MREFAAGQTIDIKTWRRGKTSTIAVHAAVFPEELAMGLALRLLGINVAALSSKNRHIYQTFAEEGVLIVEIHRQSHLARIGARPGDVIRQVDEITIKSIKDFKKAVIKYRHKSSLVIVLQRGRYLYNLSVKL